MGLFGGILNGMGGILGAIVGAGDNKHAITKASQAQLDFERQALAQQQAQFGVTQANMHPFIEAGQQASGQQGDLLGLHGDATQQTALDALKASPYFQALFKTGQEATLQNAAATGGIRGGNTERSLADFGANTFAQTIQQQLANLGSVSGLGASGAMGLGNLSQQNSNAQTGLFNQQGNTQAGAILGRQQVDNNLASQISKIISSFIPGGGMGGGMGGGGGGSMFGGPF